MKAFAYAAMLRLVRFGLIAQGLPAPFGAPAGAHVALDTKRSIAAALLDVHGATVLLRIGEAVRSVPDEPALQALTLARDPVDLMERWQRLERFAHSQHRVVVESHQERSVTLRHVSLVPGGRPQPAEHLLVFGLLVALMNVIGAGGLKARFAGERDWRHLDGRWSECELRCDAGAMEVTWRRTGVTRPARTAAGDDPVSTARAELRADPARGWHVKQLASDLHVSPRSLQRLFQDQGLTFSALLVEVRSAVAAELLTTSRQSVAEVGYVCGFSDQAHFTRVFKRHCGLTPARFRAQFETTDVPASEA
ncbi:MAG: AraC family transcriptional regulator [Pseudomonadota bacterium]